MKIVIVHSSVATGKMMATQLQEVGVAVAAEGTVQVRSEMATGPICLMVSSDLALKIQERLPDVPVYTLPDPFDVVEAIKIFEEAQKRLVAQTKSVVPIENSATASPTPPSTSHGSPPQERSAFSEHVPFRKRRIPIIMFISPKGGQGRTTVLTHMAAYAAARAKRVAILDLDVNCNAAEKFGQTTQFSSDGWRGMSVGDALSVGAAVEAMQNVYVFSYGRQLEKDVTHIDHADVQHVLGVCIEEMDVVFIDTKQEWGPIHGFLLPLASQIVYVVAAQKDALTNLSARTRDLEQRMSGRQSEVYCILNQTVGPKDQDAFTAYLVPYHPSVTVPFDAKYKQQGGMGLKALVGRCAPWWDGVFGFPVVVRKKKWNWFLRR